MGKKGINLSFEVIVVGIIALLVMIFVIVFFTGAFRGIGGDLNNVNSCEARQGNWQCAGDNDRKGYQQCIPIGCNEKEQRWCCTNE